MGTHPIFESDFDCLTEMESLPVKKTKNRSVSRWQIETPRPRDPLPNPVGYSNQRVASSEIQSGGSRGPDQGLLDKRNWDIALKNFKSIPMNLFMFYMVGDTINIMPILMIGGFLWSNIGSLLKVGSVAEQLKKNSPERYPLQLLVWILGQLAGIGLIMWKCSLAYTYIICSSSAMHKLLISSLSYLTFFPP